MSVLRDAFNEGKFMATVDAREYRQVTVIVERTPDDVLAVFCAASGWKATPIAQLAARDAEIERLRARVAELEKPAAPASIDLRLPFTQDTCPICGYAGVRKGMQLHMIRKHGTTPKEYARTVSLDA